MISLLLFLMSYPKSFAVIGDSQSNYHILRWAVNDMKVDFAVHLGDVGTCISRRRWRYVKNILFKFRPWKFVIGNHEILNCRFQYRVGYKKKWIKFWQPEIGDTVQHYRVGKWNFVHLDSSNAATKKRHVEWFRRVIKKPGKFIIFSHRAPPQNRRLRRHMDPLSRRGQNGKLWRIMNRHKNKIKAFFHGHYHAYRKYKVDWLNVYCTGGGGGRLATRRDYHHYLVVTLGKSLKINTIRIPEVRK
jgi:hypothetical protein